MYIASNDIKKIHVSSRLKILHFSKYFDDVTRVWSNLKWLIDWLFLVFTPYRQYFSHVTAGHQYKTKEPTHTHKMQQEYQSIHTIWWKTTNIFQISLGELHVLCVCSNFYFTFHKNSFLKKQVNVNFFINFIFTT